MSQEEDLTRLDVDPTGLCQQGTKFNALKGYCAPAFDKREEFLNNSEEIQPEEKFDLIEKRVEINGSYMPYDEAYVDKLIADGKISVKDITNQADRSVATSQADQGAVTAITAPGVTPCSTGLDAGITYKVNTLPAKNVGELQTNMIVHPYGVGSFNSAGLRQGCSSKLIYTTATNRTDKTLEILVHYTGDTSPSFTIFDWSCMPGYPCGTITSTLPSVVYSRTLSTMSCYYTMRGDGGGHQHNQMYYSNTSFKKDSANPPLWRNEAWLWNYCSEGWDLIYSHDFRVNQKDCDSTGACGWWGPILETTMTTQPQIKELGYRNTWLYYDEGWSTLTPNQTNWTNPASPWLLFHRNANYTYGVGK